MTIDEAIKNREDCLKYLEEIGSKASPDCLEAVRWSVQALKALRPVSREQVEKVCGGEWVHDPETGYEHCDKCSHTISLDDYMNRKPPLFCEMCGDAKTDEAVEMVMERLEALYEQ